MNIQRAIKQRGQTLIETMVAVMILTMGVSAATGLAVYALSSSSSVIKQEIAVGLAREGIEAVKNMRDTNWLKQTLSANCYNFATTANTSNCYLDWLNPSGCPGLPVTSDQGFCIDPDTSNEAASAAYILNIDRDPSHKFWTLTQQNNNFGLDVNTSIASGFTAFYQPHAGGSNGNSGYYRKLIIQKDPTGPFARANSGGASASPGPRLIVKSQVWWVDKHCPPAADWNLANPSCRLELQTALTNWKDYQP